MLAQPLRATQLTLPMENVLGHLKCTWGNTWISKRMFSGSQIRQTRLHNTVVSLYESRLLAGEIRSDPMQRALITALDDIHSSITSTRAPILDEKAIDLAEPPQRRRGSSPLPHASRVASHHVRRNLRNYAPSWWKSRYTPPKGLYVVGQVGVGKTYCMDIFHDITSGTKEAHGRACRRAHFHEFMLDVHARIHEFKKENPKEDPIPPVALALAREAQILCFDEMQVTDIADAMILKRLFSVLFALGVLVVSTSNRHPRDLYEGGLNRAQFMPFVSLLEEKCNVFVMETNFDYRKETAMGEGTYFVVGGNEDSSQSVSAALEELFYQGENHESRSISSNQEQRLVAKWDDEEEILPVMMGRSVRVTRANKEVGWFDFKELCSKPLGAADYLAISRRFPTVILSGVPQLDGNQFNEARRFVTLIDALYESRTRLIISAAVPLNELFVDFDAEDIVEADMDADEDLRDADVPSDASNNSSKSRAKTSGSTPTFKEPAIQNPTGNESIFVSGEGGSSSSMSTTMVRTKDGVMEWSATGRKGVSLAQLNAVKDVAFSFARANSRLVEMSGDEWGRARLR